MRRPSRILLVVCLSTPLIVSLCARPGLAQQRRPLLESLLRGVLDQQLEKARRESGQGTTQPSTTNMRDAQEAFRGLEREVNRLASALAPVARQSTAAARLHDDTELLRATATRAAIMAQSPNNEGAIRALAERVDRDWRDLEFRLKETFVANDSLQRYIDTINGEVRRVEQLFSLADEFSHEKVARELEAFSASVRHLAESVELELRFSDQRSSLSLAAWRIRQMAKYMAAEMQGQASLQRATQEFQSLDEQWRALAIKLRNLNDRHIARDIQRAENDLNAVRRLLRIPQRLDRSELVQLAKSLRSDTDKLFDRLTLNRLIELRSPETLIRAASEFYGLCEHFELALDDELRRDGLVDGFRTLSSSWSTLKRRLDVIRDRDTMHAIDDVDHGMHSLQLMLGAPQKENRFNLQESTSALAVLGRQLEVDIARKIRNNSRYSSSFRRSLESELSQFTTQSAQLNEAAVRNGGTVSNRDAVALAERWGQIQMLLAKLEPRDRPSVAILSSQISEYLLKLGVR